MNILNYATREVLTISTGDSLDRAILLMEEHEVHHLLVEKNGKPVGMISDRDILLSTGWMFDFERAVRSEQGNQVKIAGPTRVEQVMSRPLVWLPPTAGARGAAHIMVEKKIGALPILQNNDVLGIVTETGLMRWLDELARDGNPADLLLQQPVMSLVPPRLLSVDPDVPLEDVIDIFRRFRIRHVPVCTAGRKLVGVISDRDVRRAIGWSSVRDSQAQEAGKLAERAPTKASDVMHTDVQTTDLAGDLRSALRRMLDARTHSLPVTEKGQLCGIITMSDLTKAIVREALL